MYVWAVNLTELQSKFCVPGVTGDDNHCWVILTLIMMLESAMIMGFPRSSAGKESACNVGDLGSIPGWEDPLEKGVATHSSILAWKIPWSV